MTIHEALDILAGEVDTAIGAAVTKTRDMQDAAWDDAIKTHGANILANHGSLEEPAIRTLVRDTVETYLKANLDI